MIRHCITDRTIPSGAVRADVIHVRDKAASAPTLLEVTRAALRLGTIVVVNDRADVALAAGAHGVHLRSNPIAPREWRRILPPGFLIGVSCHDTEQLLAAEGADYVYFSPVFESPGHGPAKGLEALREAVHVSPAPVIALGGVDEANAPLCLEAGAVGVAGIRMFQ